MHQVPIRSLGSLVVVWVVRFPVKWFIDDKLGVYDIGSKDHGRVFDSNLIILEFRRGLASPRKLNSVYILQNLLCS